MIRSKDARTHAGTSPAASVCVLPRSLRICFYLSLLCLLMQFGSLGAPGDKIKPKNSQATARKADLNGIWQALNTANWDLETHGSGPPVLPALGAAGAIPPGLGVVEGGPIPYLPAALARKAENFRNRLSADPETKCYLPGVPRANYMPYPFQIVQSDGDILIAYEFAGAVRTIYMKDPGPSPIASWMGWSKGRWENGSLVVDVTSLNEQTWFDRAGNYHSDALHVTERYTLRNPDTLIFEATIEDPKVFSRPWKITMPLYRHVEDGAQLMEFKCVPFAEEILYGPLRHRRTN
ncbi:MAG TPA: hypothetical protein VIX89_20915 [Bryobacteraceae bacterium]